MPCTCSGFEGDSQDAQDSPESISQNPSQKGTASPHEMTMGYEGLLDLLIWLGF